MDNSAFQLKIQDLVSKFKNKQTTKTKGVGTQVSGSVNIFNLQYTIKRKGPPLTFRKYTYIKLRAVLQLLPRLLLSCSRFNKLSSQNKYIFSLQLPKQING